MLVERAEGSTGFGSGGLGLQDLKERFAKRGIQLEDPSEKRAVPTEHNLSLVPSPAQKREMELYEAQRAAFHQEQQQLQEHLQLHHDQHPLEVHQHPQVQSRPASVRGSATSTSASRPASVSRSTTSTTRTEPISSTVQPLPQLQQNLIQFTAQQQQILMQAQQMMMMAGITTTPFILLRFLLQVCHNNRQLKQ